MNWVAIGKLTDIPRRGARCVASPLGRIAIFRTAEDEIFAIEDRCPHKGGPLAQGIVHGRAVTCPLHNAVIDLSSGEMQGPDEGRVRTFRLRLNAEEQTIELSLDLSTLAEAAE